MIMSDENVIATKFLLHRIHISYTTNIFTKGELLTKEP